jgi:glycosyltransferase involved in cell wall biosynthesis
MEKTNIKKKVLYFIPSFPVRSETFIQREVSKLIDRDNLDLTVFSLDGDRAELYENVKPCVKYYRLNWKDVFTSIPFIVVRRSQVLKAFKLVKKDKTKSFFGRFFLFLKSLAYAYVFSRLNPDHIHVHFMSDSSTIVMVASVLLDVPYSISGHAIDVVVYGSLISEKALTSKFIAVCNQTVWAKVVKEANKVKKSGKVKLMFHGIDYEKTFGETLHINKPDRPLIYSVPSRLVEKKGVEYLIKASKILKDRGIDHFVYIVGYGERYQEYLDLIAGLGLEETVKILGDNKGLPNEEVIAYMKIADIYAFPNTVSREGDIDGVPTTVIEAAMAKLPIIVTSAGSTTDLIEDNVTGLIIREKDEEELAGAIIKLMESSSLRDRLGEKAFIKARGMFDLEKNIEDLEKLFIS